MTFDYIIVGAGTAGCVLAERLTASGRNRVVLVEAGRKSSNPFVGIPAGFARLFGSRYDWAFTSEPQANAGGRKIFVPRGKMLGGSASLNAQIHQWARLEDFEGWRQLGLSDWGWSQVEPYFAELEAAGADIPGVDRGRDGPMLISRNAHVHRATRDFVEAAQPDKARSGPTYNGTSEQGAWIAEVTHHRGRRYSVYDAFLKSALQRPNLHLLSGLPAQRILFEGRRAVGIVADGRTVTAAKGVILAAGAIGSPHLLMVSGVGAADHLLEVGIKPLVSLSGVGENLHDHPMAVLSFPTAHADTYRTAESIPNLLRYLLRRKGPLASNAAEAVAFAHSSLSSGAPDMELIFAPFEWREQALKPPHEDAFSIGAVVNTPRSRGRLSLASSDPERAPRIDFRLFTDPDDHDQHVMIEAVRWMHEVLRRPPLAKHLRDMPGLPGDPNAIFELAITGMQTVYHPAGTCRMGVDAGAVVGPDLKLRGTDNLWIADASIMPQLPSGHPNATVAVIAARAAQFIADHERRAFCDRFSGAVPISEPVH
ncbi:GMC family oxidoreductase [Sphingomonas sp. LHG3406-1]|uniref:GMC family oxidoreductase n=1 Tax=Sphingomonas sp. LHG3406-1 TaxID=2804617 RepID=UPI00262F7023|nr:GMC family oxidoreductase N-terminal domain-containing protein [Sphingomonas sp. LHG3406-1]